MLRISELKKLNNLLWSLANKLSDNVENYVDIAYQIKNVNIKIEYKDFILKLLELDNNLGTITLNANLFRKNFQELYEQIDNEIHRISQSYLNQPKMLNGEPYLQIKDYKTELRYRTNVTNYREELDYRISLHTSWKYPALHLGCKDGQLTRNLIAADPLYITDFYSEYLETTKKQFNPQYQNRLCVYKLDHTSIEFNQFPQHQFAFILGWDTLEHFSYDYLKNCLEQLKQLLRPGGVIMFNYNNCEKISAIEHFEWGVRPWMTPKLIENLANELEFEIINHVNKENDLVDWIELKLPGTLNTVKAHQVLGEFCNIA